ncbi:hypothetical protein [Nannocystis radixulma]|uniref:Uncharacterized protein n=1 Tax=Nannocystis radixulma TaxID=2995305 RepID=A0ABT5BSY0_9BACT|nr:hypothetical protein [Nannocystis radixulma]MDC0676026.1 hypothetical protein [Nannocystis radixulma]
MPSRGVPQPAQEPAAPPTASVAPPAPAPVAEATCDYPAEAPARFDELQASEGPCRAVPARVARELGAEIRERWARSWPKGRLEIRGGCDRLGAQPSSIVIESCEGHGGVLTLARFDRQADGAYDLVLLEYDHDGQVAGKDDQNPWQAHASGPLAVRRARLDGAVMASLLERLRAAAHVEIEEHEPPPRKDNSFVATASGSSHYYHAALRLVDDRGRGVQHVFTGHEGTGHEQKLGVPLAIVARDLDTLLADPAVRSRFTELGADDPAARELFARVFWAARARGDEPWYVDQLLGMTALLGSAQHMPALVEQLRARGERDITRTDIVVVNAIAALAGYDVRHDASGKPRPLASVVADTLAACEKR